MRMGRGPKGPLFVSGDLPPYPRPMPRISPVPRELRPLVATVLAAALIVLVWTGVPVPAGIDLGRISFWIAVTAVAAALPVKLPGGVHATMTTAPVLAVVFDSALPNPFAAVWIAFLGSIELRDLRRELPWYGTVYNRSNYALAAFVAWIALSFTAPAVRPGDPLGVIAQIALVGGAFAVVNFSLALSAAAIRTHQPLSKVWSVSLRNILVGLAAQAPIGWLMAEIATAVGQWAVLLVMVPLLLARYSFSRYTELRELFFGSVSALSQAIDAKDGFTRGHADRVSRIAGAMAREMRLPEREIEQIELAGLLHDIGKIGVEDRVLLKPARLDQDETELMRRHPVYGAAILEPSAALRPLVPLVLAHHENYDGTGYPRGLKGDAIPVGARIIIVADAYEAMTADRVYRKAIGHERAMAQLEKHKGAQFDPKVVRALDALLKRRGPSAFEVSDLPPITYETLDDLRRRLARRTATHDARAD